MTRLRNASSKRSDVDVNLLRLARRCPRPLRLTPKPVPIARARAKARRSRSPGRLSETPGRGQRQRAKPSSMPWTRWLGLAVDGYLFRLHATTKPSKRRTARTQVADGQTHRLLPQSTQPGSWWLDDPPRDTSTPAAQRSSPRTTIRRVPMLSRQGGRMPPWTVATAELGPSLDIRALGGTASAVPGEARPLRIVRRRGGACPCPCPVLAKRATGA